MSDLPSHRLDGKREVPSYTSTTTDEREAVERVRRLLDRWDAADRFNMNNLWLFAEAFAKELRTLLHLVERDAVTRYGEDAFMREYKPALERWREHYRVGAATARAQKGDEE